MVGVILFTHVLVIISSILFILPVLCPLVPFDDIHLQKEYVDLVVIGLLCTAYPHNHRARNHILAKAQALPCEEALALDQQEHSHVDWGATQPL